MDLTLTRARFGAEGVFGYLIDSTGGQVAVTCEHAYEQLDGTWKPKVPPGRYLCQRGTHSLADGINFTTFEITDVPGHTGILLHKGNVNSDSAGCVLLGTHLGELLEGAQLEDAVLGSKDAFDLFMNTQLGINEFWLVVQ